MKSVFIIVPSLSATGPIFGALALANGLSKYLPVSLVALKPAATRVEIQNSRIKVISLSDLAGNRNKKNEIIRLLKKNGDRNANISISSCFSADIVNSQLKNYARIISSVRGNLLKVYRFDYGWLGIFAALLHYIALHRFDHVVAISNKMANQLKFYGISAPVIIRNFVDEELLEKNRLAQKKLDRTLRFVFLGRLTLLKRPFLLIQAFSDLLHRGVKYRLEIVGDGPLRHKLEHKCNTLGLKENVTFHGHLSNPFKLLQQCQVLILPSETEGISRAVLEGLYYGIPCILRDIDANYELLSDNNKNCYLFKKDTELVDTMELAARSFFSGEQRGDCNLLPEAFRQDHNVRKFLELILNES